MHYLSEAFSLFSLEAQELQESYAKLQQQLDSVNGELHRKIMELNRVNRVLHNVLQHISDAILFLDLKGTILLCNHTGERLLQKKDLSLRRFSEVFPDDFFGFSMQEALILGIAHPLLYHKDWEIATTFVYEGPKSYHGLIVVFRDISEKNKMQQGLHRQDRFQELGAMAATIAHEIRNPLGGIRGYASLLHQDLEKLPPQKEMASAILQGTQRLESLVSSILQYARPISISPVSLEVGTFLRSILRFAKADPQTPSTIFWSIHIPKEPFWAPIDEQALRGALLNLFTNGIEAMSGKGTLTVALLRHDLSYQISISDTGEGIEEDLLPKLFSRFFTTKEGGNGIGLHETQKIVQAHFGTIEVRSKKGKGTTFTLTLPIKR